MALLHVSGEMAVVSFDPDTDVKISEKGVAWARLRCVSKDRVRDSNGVWSDGEPCFMDVYINGKLAENLADSVRQGDLITVVGSLSQKPWTDNEGVKRDGYRIQATEVGVSLRFTTAPSERARSERDSAGVEAAKAGLGATEVEDSPF